MSGIFVLVPILTLGPVVLTATSAAASALGFAVMKGHLDDLRHLVEENSCPTSVVQFDVAEAKGLTDLVRSDGPITLERDDATLCFRYDEGRTQLSVRGKAGQPPAELETLGRTVLDTIAQQYAYHLVVSDLKQRGFDKVLEKAEADGTIKVQLRRWD
jgi:hypothetical protein